MYSSGASMSTILCHAPHSRALKCFVRNSLPTEQDFPTCSCSRHPEASFPLPLAGGSTILYPTSAESDHICPSTSSLHPSACHQGLAVLVTEPGFPSFFLSYGWKTPHCMRTPPLVQQLELLLLFDYRGEDTAMCRLYEFSVVRICFRLSGKDA